MTAIAAHTTWMTRRQIKAIVRQPAYVVIMLIQPVIWLFLFGSLFRKVVELPGFGTASYLDYLVPGVVIMSALSASMWSGMTVLEEIDRGVMDRFLVLPLHRSAIINASAVMQAMTCAVQSIIIVLLGWAGALAFLSTAFMAESLMPHGMRIVASCNPVNWALEAGRTAMGASPDWSRVLVQGGGLALLAVAVTALSVLMFRTYEKSV